MPSRNITTLLTPPPSLFLSPLQTIESLQRHIQQGTGGETSKIESQINSAKKTRVKSEAKLKQRVQDMHKYTDVYRSGMEVEFQRCQEEEHGMRQSCTAQDDDLHVFLSSSPFFSSSI